MKRVLTVVFPQRFHIFHPSFRLRILDISSCGFHRTLKYYNFYTHNGSTFYLFLTPQFTDSNFFLYIS